MERSSDKTRHRNDCDRHVVCISVDTVRVGRRYLPRTSTSIFVSPPPPAICRESGCRGLSRVLYRMVADASVRPRPSALGHLLPPLGQPARFSSSQFPDSIAGFLLTGRDRSL